MAIGSAETNAPADSLTSDLDDPKLYLNRELSWLQFNARVLEEAEDHGNPLLERVKFLSIFSSNLDEFLMIRISGLREQLSGGVREGPPDGMTTSEQLAAVRQEVLCQLARFSDCWRNDILPKLNAQDVYVLRYHQLQPKQQHLLRGYFSKEIFPALTPLAFDPSHPFPHISNLSLNLAVVGQDPERGECFARVKIPNIFPRLVRIPSEDMVNEADQFGLPDSAADNFVWIEDVVAANLDLLFPCLLYTSPSPRDRTRSRMPSSA